MLFKPLSIRLLSALSTLPGPISKRFVLLLEIVERIHLTSPETGTLDQGKYMLFSYHGAILFLGPYSVDNSTLIDQFYTRGTLYLY
jgi:hypothetical protein